KRGRDRYRGAGRRRPRRQGHLSASILVLRSRQTGRSRRIRQYRETPRRRPPQLRTSLDWRNRPRESSAAGGGGDPIGAEDGFSDAAGGEPVRGIQLQPHTGSILLRDAG